MSDVTILSIDMIVSNPKIRNGRPIIAGTTLRVQDIAIAHVYKGDSLGEVVRQYPTVSLAQVHAALSCYYEHRDEIDKQIADDDQFFQEAKEKGLGQRRPPVLR
jgi:uncharacterized protein (DUF433 family)